jgi:hypothetical protein
MHCTWVHRRILQGTIRESLTPASQRAYSIFEILRSENGWHNDRAALHSSSITKYESFDVWYKPYAERFINAVKDAGFVNSYNGLCGRCSVPISGVAPGQALTVSGQVHSPSGISQDFVFLREQGKGTFILAAELHKEKQDISGVVYDWDATLDSQLIQDRTHELEMWIYNNTSNAFLKIDQGKW